MDEKGKSDYSNTNKKALANQLLKEIQQRHNLYLSDFFEILTEALPELKQLPTKPTVEKDTFPLSIFNKQLTVLESIVKYLREEKDKSLTEIAAILGRNQRNLWHTYNSAKKKMSSHLPVNHDINVPVSIFQDSKLSPTEALVYYLKEQRQLPFSEIAKLLHRNDRTVWTTYSRAKKKYGKT